jgi:23S rRNA (pseudouridine1915-N3)-methyltransferase
MQIQLWSIGKAGEAYAEQGTDLYIKRLKHYIDFTFELISPIKNSANLSVDELKKQEGKMLLSLLDKTDFVIALDEKGKLFTTIQLTEFMNQKTSTGIKKMIFIIGGAFGLDEAILQRANFTLSLSPLTFPHQLARLITTEQLYRVFTILHNQQYHHQ